jgi:NADH:ubiquinone oxidoreductase subunit 6 (subunit J)
MSNRLLIAGGIAAIALLLIVIVVRGYRNGEIALDLSNSPSPNALLNITVRRESFPTVYWIVMGFIGLIAAGMLIGAVVVARGSG